MHTAWTLLVLAAPSPDLFMVGNAPTFGSEERDAALRVMEEDLPWTSSCRVMRSCLQSASPYTIRFSLTHGETSHTIDCMRPWCTTVWMCLHDEEGDVDDAMECAM